MVSNDCDVLGGNHEFISRQRIAANCVLCAYLKVADLCAVDPAVAARFLSDKLYEPCFQCGLKVMIGMPFDLENSIWRTPSGSTHCVCTKSKCYRRLRKGLRAKPTGAS